MLSTAQRCARIAGPRPLALRRVGRVASVQVRAGDDNKFDGFKPTVAAFFPGQGAQTVGMAKDLVAEVPAAKELFDKASEILGYDLLQVCMEGPKEKLDTTAVSQPAIYVSSLAAVEKLRATEGQAAVDAIDVAAGLSLGEYTALAFAGAIKFEDGLKLVKLRGESMQAAADAKESGMVSVIGLQSDKVKELCEAATSAVGADKPVQIANYLCPGNYAVSGSKEGCDEVVARGKEFKARMTVRLAVAGAFHTQYMEPAVAKLKEALAATEIITPRIPVVSNVDAKPHSDPETIRDILSRQVTSPVLWENTMTDLFDKGLTKSYEIGPNKVIAGIAKRINKAHEIVNISA
uniref:Malonyl-CoA:ACP transacylase (MAT) domain-containing protein n=1 Tax=Chlamydomonas euryale TaxID=1486919 RepID=A0A7R9YU04_9CHLO|mmetsp:Transcript_23837/g.70736  ORF Transcript_23837/g.70736 Transcript_23837/m.70736 type:complete len:349 (+) Transcript_23837:32-1078(+)